MSTHLALSWKRGKKTGEREKKKERRYDRKLEIKRRLTHPYFSYVDGKRADKIVGIAAEKSLSVRNRHSGREKKL